MMNLYSTIFTRRSVREYTPSPLGEAELASIKAVLDGAKQLPGQGARFEVVGADNLKKAPAPHAVLAYSQNTDAALCNIGYTLETLDLHLQGEGLGSLWMGMGKPAQPGADYRILLAFGKTDVPARQGEADFKRKPIGEISNEDNAIARAARRAPSAVNFQPWKLHFAPGAVTIHYDGKGLGRLVAAKFQKIDLGIITKFVELALAHEGKTVTSITPGGTGKSFAVTVEYT
jgi:hypothetical protein